MTLKLPSWRPPGGLRPWVAGISLLLVLLALWSHGQEVLALAPDQRGWALLILGLALTVVAQWANGLAWWALLRWLQLALPLLEMVQLFVRTNLLKYLPGGIWHQVDRVRLLRQRGASGRRALLAVLLEALLMAQQIALPQLKAFLRETGRLQSLEAGLNLSAVPLRTLGFGFGFDH